MPIERSPPSPLSREDSKKHNSNCNICLSAVSSSSSVNCTKCLNVYHIKCAFANGQEDYYMRNKLIWMCPCCFFNSVSSTNSAIAELHKSFDVVNSKFGECINSIAALQTSVTNVCQDINRRMDIVEEVNLRTSSKLSTIEGNYTSHCISIEGLRNSWFKSDDDTRNLIKILFSVLKVELNFEFVIKWYDIKNLHVFMLNKNTVELVMCAFHKLTNTSNSGMLSDEYDDIKSKIQSTNIMLTSVIDLPLYASIRMDNLEIDKLSKDIKINGLQYLIDETPDKLVNYVIEISKYLDITLTTEEFKVRRIKNTASIIVTFRDADSRHSLFYSFMNLMKTLKSNKNNIGSTSNENSQVKSGGGGGIPKGALLGVPCSSNIRFGDNLCMSSRILNQFCFMLKMNNKIHAFSTRRGKVVVKVKDGDDFSVVNSIEDLFRVIHL